MEECMKMPGGGPFNLSPGQITDDSELAMCMMQGINAGIEKSGKY
jgi:ADP-ribosylglycohydrolase